MLINNSNKCCNTHTHTHIKSSLGNILQNAVMYFTETYILASMYQLLCQSTV